jgi:methylated-DNA-[protein]-cysteine S-methyltransferase
MRNRRERCEAISGWVGPLPVETDQGCFWAWYSDCGLMALAFPDQASAPPFEGAVPACVRRWHAQTERAVRAVLAGRTPPVCPPLDWRGATPFQREVWRTLLQIPRGEVRTYGDVARAVGRAGGARAVGRACASNPIPLLVPCHRVIGAGGGLGGFSAGSGWKRKLLALEGAAGIRL